MKQFLLLGFIILISLTLRAQTTDVVTGIENLNRLIIDGNTLYFSTSTAVFKFDITEPAPVPLEIVSGLANPNGLAIDGNTLYMAEFGGGRISTIDVTDLNPTRVDFITGLNTPNQLLLDGNFLYFSDNNTNKVERIDLTAPIPVTELVAAGVFNIDPIGLAKQGDILYMSQAQVNRVSTVDVTDSNTTPTDVVVGVNRPIGLAIDNNMLYITERNDHKISVKDLGSPTNLSTDLVVGLNLPEDIAISNSVMFICDNGANKISKFELIVGIEDYTENAIGISPNPAVNYIEVAELTETVEYTIYNILGEQLTKGSISPQEQIDISELSSGIFILQLSNKGIAKFIKR